MYAMDKHAVEHMSKVDAHQRNTIEKFKNPNLLNMNEKAYMMARYLLELSLVEYSFLKYTPSNIAASAAYLAAKIFKMKTTWNQLVAECSQYTETDVRSCAKKLCELITKGKASSLDAVKRKFTHKKFYEVG